MATVAGTFTGRSERPDVLSGTPRAHAIDRWIFVFMAAWFIAIVLTGFIPDSLEKVAAVQAGERPPFPLVLHVHAVLMGSFLSLLLAQTTLAATGRIDLHRRLGLAGMILATAMPLPAGIDRIAWLPSTMPWNPMSADLYTLLAVSPMFF